MDLGIKGKVALVTGGAFGIGKETARQLLEEGVTVVLTDNQKSDLEETAKELGTSQPVYAYPADMTSTEDLKKLHDYVQEIVGKIDILVQNAGIAGEQGLFHELDDDAWTNTMDINLFGSVRVVREFLPDLRSGGWGRIVFLASENGEQPYKEELPYNCTKAALLSFSKGLSKTYASDGLLVNAVSPAFIETPMTDKLVEDKAEEENVSFEEGIDIILNEQKVHLELKRRGKVEEAANVIVFLCSDKASFVTGSNYRVDGGSVATI